MRRITIKEGPFVFIRNVVAMEILATAALYAISFLENYEQLYIHFGFSKILRYDIFLMLSFSAFQLFYIVGLFFNWYFKYYEITDKEIIRKTGLFFKRKKSVSISQIASVEIAQSPFERFMQHATLQIDHNNGRTTKIRNVREYEECVAVIKQAIENGNKRASSYTLSELLKDGENRFVEFKQTLRWDTRNNQTHKDIERAIAKTIVGFLNSEGGTLVIGVDDSGKVTGLNQDYNSLPKKNRDGFENHFTMIIKTMIGIKFRSYINIRFVEQNGLDVCIVDVEKSHKPAYLQSGDGKEEFFVRAGNSTQPLTMSEAEEYIKTRWGS